jgi:flagellin
MSITRINSNVPAVNAARNLNVTGARLARSLERLSTGLRINRGGDDAAGLAISEKMRSQIRGIHRASQNAQDGISLIQTAEGAMQEIHNILQRLRELAVQAHNGIYTENEIAAMQDEADQLVDEIDRIAKEAEFNTFKLLDGSVEEIELQVGPNEGQTISLLLVDMKVKGGGWNSGRGDEHGQGHAYGHEKKKIKFKEGIRLKNFDVDGSGSNGNSIARLDMTIGYVSMARAEMGASQNRLESVIANLGVSGENLAAAESRIRDADIAYETVQFTRNTILVQSGTTVLAQANIGAQNILGLLG